MFKERSQGSALNIKQNRLAVVTGLVGLRSTSQKGENNFLKK